jgi:hypothetical protein
VIPADWTTSWVNSCPTAHSGGEIESADTEIELREPLLDSNRFGDLSLC